MKNVQFHAFTRFALAVGNADATIDFIRINDEGWYSCDVEETNSREQRRLNFEINVYRKQCRVCIYLVYIQIFRIIRQNTNNYTPNLYRDLSVVKIFYTTVTYRQNVKGRFLKYCITNFSNLLFFSKNL